VTHQRAIGEMTAAGEDSSVQFRFETSVIYWRGPSPFFFAPIPSPHAKRLQQVSKFVTYGWGMVPVEATIGGVVFKTSLFPKDETYLLPIKTVVRRKTNITAGDSIFVEMTIRPSQR
jgi:Domain of unknown function (DUF1905)